MEVPKDWRTTRGTIVLDGDGWSTKKHNKAVSIKAVYIPDAVEGVNPRNTGKSYYTKQHCKCLSFAQAPPLGVNRPTSLPYRTVQQRG